jgi:hypothetical protein
LIRDLERTQDPSSASAIAQALSGVAANLNPEQAQLVVGTLLKSAPGDASGSRINALALVFGAVAPNVNQDSAAAMNAFLVRALATARDPELAARIGVALSSLKWAPTATQSELLVGPVVDVLSRARDPVHLGDIATIIIALAPTLQRKTAQNAIEEIRPIVRRAPAILNPALSALTKRVDQTGSEVPPAAQQPANLLQRVSASRWCTSSRSYSLQLVGNTATWRDNLGSVDTETVVLNNASDAQTVTQRSVHTDGNSEPIGTTWNYHMTGIDTVSVKSGNKKSFTLKRC